MRRRVIAGDHATPKDDVDILSTRLVTRLSIHEMHRATAGDHVISARIHGMLQVIAGEHEKPMGPPCEADSEARLVRISLHLLARTLVGSGVSQSQ